MNRSDNNKGCRTILSLENLQLNFEINLVVYPISASILSSCAISCFIYIIKLLTVEQGNPSEVQKYIPHIYSN